MTTGSMYCPSAIGGGQDVPLADEAEGAGEPEQRQQADAERERRPTAAPVEALQIVQQHRALADPLDRGDDAERRERGERVGEEVEQHRRRRRASVPGPDATSR